MVFHDSPALTNVGTVNPAYLVLGGCFVGRVYGYFSEGKHLEERTQSMPVLHSVNPTSRRPAFSESSICTYPVPANVFLRNETIHGTSAECLTKHSKPILQELDFPYRCED